MEQKISNLIYKIISKNPEISEFYVGSTIDLYKRLHVHKNHCKEKNTMLHSYIRNNGGWSNFKCEVIETFSCQTSNQKRERERYYIELLLPTLNQRKPIINRLDKNEYQRVYMKKYVQTSQKHKEYYRKYMKLYMRKIYLKRKMEKQNIKSELLKEKLELLKNGFLEFD
jgi:hypothetical protein